ncbi:metal ABC transporter permease [Mobiluncus mulieris]|uniref:metal ABC transporter permease n=1 Tax=Mobiluncus mulieris TaxID=2052 RepID=UPI002092973B|nr:metal ABC transporter permease [Mobiluncus mulieris]
MLWVAPLVSVGCVVLGAYISYWFDTASGATVVALEGVLFWLSGVWICCGGARFHEALA